MTTLRLPLSLLAFCLAGVGSGGASSARAEATASTPVVVTPPVTYTPMRTAPARPSPAAPVVPAPAATRRKAPVPTAPVSSSRPRPRLAPAVPKAATPPILQASPRRPAPQQARKRLALGTDLGVPDGLHLALAVEPLSWLRLTVAGGSNTASYGGRLGLTLIPMGFGPSLSVEGGFFPVAEPNGVVRAFFKVPKWVEPYVQQIGYRYLNAQLGYDVRLGDFVVYLHGGYSFIRGVVRSPESVVVDGDNGYTVRMRDDGVVRAYTWSFKAAVLYRFAGG